MSADLVAGPKYVVSWFGEPGPVFDTVKPCLFRNIWSCLTSLPVIPSLSDLKKVVVPVNESVCE